MRFTLPLRVLACGLAASCASDPQAHHYVSTSCEGTHCGIVDHTGAGPGGQVDGGGSLGDGGFGTGNLTGLVTVFNDAAFLNRVPFTGTGTIVVRGAHDVTGTLTGSSFSVDSTDALNPVWVGIRATTGGTDLMPTITPVDGTATSVEVSFGRTSDVASIVALLTQTPLAMRSDAAQIVVGFVDSSHRAVSGVQITQSTGAAILYDAGSSYSDAFGSTQSRGMAVIVNATAGGTFPGQKLTVTYKGATSTLGTFDVYACQGALTIATVQVK